MSMAISHVSRRFPDEMRIPVEGTSKANFDFVERRSLREAVWEFVSVSYLNRLPLLDVIQHLQCRPGPQSTVSFCSNIRQLIYSSALSGCRCISPGRKLLALAVSVH